MPTEIILRRAVIAHNAHHSHTSCLNLCRPLLRGVCCCAAGAALLAGTVLFTGCTGSREKTRGGFGSQAGQRPQTHVISGTPGRDAGAFNQSERQLTHARWGVLEHMGPESMWKKWNTSRYRRMKKAEKQNSSTPHGVPYHPPEDAPPAGGAAAGGSAAEATPPDARTDDAAERDEADAPGKTHKAAGSKKADQANAKTDHTGDTTSNVGEASGKTDAGEADKEPDKPDKHSASAKDEGSHVKNKDRKTDEAKKTTDSDGDKSSDAGDASGKADAGKDPDQPDPADPSAGPSAAPSAQGLTRDAQFPLTVIKLPGDRVQLIWKLRNYGGTSVTARRDGGTSRRKVTLKPPDLSPLVSVIKSRLGKKDSVLSLPRQNTLVINCDKDQRRDMVDLLSRIDIPKAQVEITAKIFEVSSDFDYQQGARFLLKHLGNDGSQSALSTFDTNRLLKSLSGHGDRPFQGSVIGLVQEFKQAGISLNVSLQLLAETGMINVIASPRLMVAAGESGYMLAGKELPIQSSQVTGDHIKISTTYKPVGVQLYITPQSVGPRRVRLHMVSVVSSIAGFAPLPSLSTNNPAALLLNPVIKSREAQTAVSIRQGNTLVISGLRRIRTLTRENKIPWLGSLPLIGNLFKNHRSQQKITDLYFFITPTLIQNG